MINNFNQTKRELLEKQKDGLTEEYRAVSEQLSRELSAANQEKHKRQLAFLEAEIRRIENEIAQLDNAVPVPPSTPLSPNELYQRTIRALNECEEFDKDDDLLALFRNDQLRPYRNSIPQAPNKQRRVTGTVAVLKGNKRRDGRDGLVILLELLRDLHGEEFALHQELDYLARCWTSQTSP